MNTKLVMASSALVLGIAGVAGIFAPHEIAAALAMRADGFDAVMLQLWAAAIFAFAVVNWMSKDSLIGGIYHRPLTVANLAHFMIGGLGLVRYSIDAGLPLLPSVAAVIYGIFAVSFGSLLFRSPVRSDRSSPS